MAENNETPLAEYGALADDIRRKFIAGELDDPITLNERVQRLWQGWANFELYIVSPVVEIYNPPRVHEPEWLNDEEREFVYPIYDYGYRLVTSKGEEMYTSGMSMCKLFYTIEKMIYILIERLKGIDGVTTETEVQVAFEGHLLAQRKAFESIINLAYNVVVTNFDPGAWGERYLAVVKRIAEKYRSYPSETPRTVFRRTHAETSTRMKQK